MYDHVCPCEACCEVDAKFSFEMNGLTLAALMLLVFSFAAVASGC